MTQGRKSAATAAPELAGFSPSAYTILDRWGNAFTIEAESDFASLEGTLDWLVAVIIGRAIREAE